MSLPRLTLILGGARSGKSAFAESLLDGGERPVYVATAQALDDEMRERIARHRQRRDARWRTIEAPLELADAVTAVDPGADAVLVDCLTVWLGNLMHAGRSLDRESDALLESLAASRVPLVVVANEVGLGVVPGNAMAREFRDRAGLLNQGVAARADRVHLVTAGIPILIKDS